MSEGRAKHEPVGTSLYMGERARNGAGCPDVGGSEKEAENGAGHIWRSWWGLGEVGNGRVGADWQGAV